MMSSLRSSSHAPLLTRLSCEWLEGRVLLSGVLLDRPSAGVAPAGPGRHRWLCRPLAPDLAGHRRGALLQGLSAWP